MDGIGISRRASCERRIKPPPRRLRTSSHFQNDNLTRRRQRIHAPKPRVTAFGLPPSVATIACFDAALPQRIENGQANGQAELAAQDDRDAGAGRPLQAEVPRRCFDDAVSNRLRGPLVARSDHTILRGWFGVLTETVDRV
jgi:hypothetical protein